MTSPENALDPVAPVSSSALPPVVPVSREAIAHGPTGPAPGIGLCLSGGGYRAMLFHLGTLWRLNSAGMLPKLTRISSVSGGSITAGVLGANWNELTFDADGVATNFEEKIAAPLLGLADTTIFDLSSVWTTGLSLLESLFNHDLVVNAYRKIMGTKTLQDLPGDEANDYTPRFIFNATNLQSGSLWRFSKPYMADWRIGEIKNPGIELAVAVAASSAFPIGLPPIHLKFEPGTIVPLEGSNLLEAPYNQEAYLVDGGVYDNMGMETVWKEYKMVLVSDAGGLIGPEAHPVFGGRDPARVFGIIDNQVGSLRKRQLIGSYKLESDDPNHRDGSYWGIGSDISQYGLLPDQHLNCPIAQTQKLAAVGTIIQMMEKTLQLQLVNWGFAICDAGLRGYCTKALQSYQVTLTQPADFPYPAAGV